MKDKLPESEISNNELSVPAFDKLTSSPSSSFVVTSNTFVWPLVTSILVERSTNVGALSLIFKISIDIKDDVIDISPSDALIKKL